ncbi:MAG: DUF3489 domain-containing protein [Steroidobacteraceae bacterium]
MILSAACQRADHSVYPLATKLNGGAAHKVLNSLLGKGLVKEVRASRDDALWREDKKRGRLTLRATPAAYEALGIDPAEASDESTGAPEDAHVAPDEPEGTSAPADANGAPVPPAARRGNKRKPKAAPEMDGPPRMRANSKQAQLIDMLKRPEGASIEEIVAAFGWQAHTVRGAIAGALKKKLGLNVGSEKIEGRGRVYHIA